MASITIMVAILGLLGFLFWPYGQEYLWGNWERIFWLVLGVVQATWLNFGRFQRAEVIRQESDGGIIFIVGLLMFWLIALIAGVNLHAANFPLT